jgi:methylmalonyl-CoA mutase N-terminal domain/subunit
MKIMTPQYFYASCVFPYEPHDHPLICIQERQIRRLKELKERRNNSRVKASLDNLRHTLENDKANCIAPILNAVQEYATLGEITEIGRQVFGDWKEPGIL